MQEAISGYASLLEGNAAFLNMLARLYYKPLSQEELEAVAALDMDEFDFDDPRVAEGLKESITYLRAGGTTLRQDVNVDYTSAFYGINSYEGKVAHPCESVFTGEEGLLMQAETRAVYRIYKSEGIKKEDDLGVPDDHLSFELQFLAKMCTRAAEALAMGDVAEAIRNMKVQLAFLDEHILVWYPKMKAVAMHLLLTPFYFGVLKATDGYLASLRADLEEMVVVLGAAEAQTE